MINHNLQSYVQQYYCPFSFSLSFQVLKGGAKRKNSTRNSRLQFIEITSEKMFFSIYHKSYHKSKRSTNQTFKKNVNICVTMVL